MSVVFTRSFLDRGERKIVFERIQDIEPIIDNNKRLQNESQSRTSPLLHIASIPNVIIEKWMNEEGAPVLAMSAHEFAKFIRKKLNDPDNRFLRTDK